MQTSEVLNKAADLIEVEGWWQDRPGGGVGKCASNAISTVAQREQVSILPAHIAFAEHVGVGRPLVRNIADWNDAPERTATEVIEALRAAALIEAAKENAETREPVSA